MEGVARELVRRDIIPKDAGLCALDQQVSNDAAEVLLRSGDVLTAMQERRELEGEICRCFEALISTLKPEYAEILRRVDLEGERPVEFAARRGLTANAAMVKLHRARRALRARLEQTCRTCASHGCLDCTCGGPPTASGRDEKPL